MNLPIDSVPHVTILRPVKGIEPHLYACLAATFQQTYPKQKLTIYFCISSRADPAFLILEQLLADFSGFDVRILVEEEDPNLSGRDGDTYNLGPNPKIRNMSRGYREAKGDIIWIIDCNVWVSRSVCGSMVDRLCGFTSDGKKYKFVHQLPLVVDISESLPTSNARRVKAKQGQAGWGSLLDELFLSTSHAKFYTAINTVAIAPCIVGKSNMFRRSHLDALTTSPASKYAPGIDYFSNNICEDHLIGDLLWKRPVPLSVLDVAASEGQQDSPINESKKRRDQKWCNHALIPYSLAIQPMAHLPLPTYFARRTRWLRVRKFTVPVATLVEPGTESFLCSLYGAYGFTYLNILGFPSTWRVFVIFWVISVGTWMLVDWYLWRTLQSGKTYGGEEGEPAFAPSHDHDKNRRSRHGWWTSRIVAWVGREALAFWIWIWAVVGGVEVDWRGRKFWVGWDASVHEIDGSEGGGRETDGKRYGKRE